METIEKVVFLDITSQGKGDMGDFSPANLGHLTIIGRFIKKYQADGKNVLRFAYLWNDQSLEMSGFIDIPEGVVLKRQVLQRIK